MFDVDRAVTRLSESVYADRCASAARVEELRDHIHCEIDRARAQGMSAEQAFAAAAAKLGTRAGLAAEYAKNRSLFGLICAWDARQERGLRGRVPAAILTAHGIVWATAMVAGSLVMKQSAGANPAAYWLLGVMVPLWWASELVVRSAIRGARSRDER